LVAEWNGLARWLRSNQSHSYMMSSGFPVKVPRSAG
jgi:hypothetical protein